MKTILLNRWTKLKSSLWFVPSLLAAGGILGALGAIYVDKVRPPAAQSLWTTLLGSSEGASNLLTTIAGSMITVTGVVFSITIVTLSLASGQFGPRILRNFMQDRGNQVVLGTFIATFLYGLVAMTSVHPGISNTAVPRVTVLAGLGLAIASIAVLIYFIHHIARSIQAESVCANIAGEIHRAIDILYPEGIALGGPRDHEGPPPDMPDFENDGHVVTSQRSGYLQAVDEDGLVKLARKHDLVLRVRVRPGKFVVQDTPVMDAWPEERVTRRVHEKLTEAVVVGDRRTEEQDVEYGVDQLVEVAVRALSPGINDPFTALTCIDHLSGTLCRMSARAVPSRYRYHEDQLRVVTRRSSYGGILDEAFNQIRQYGKSSVAVMARLLEAIDTIAMCTTADERRQLLKAHADRVIEDVRTQDYNPTDLADIEARYRDVVKVLGFDVAGASRSS